MKLLIDSNNLAFRAKSTINLTTKGGEDVSAIFGTLKMLHSYLKKTSGGWKNKMLDDVREYMLDRTLDFDDVIMCWDGGKSKFRKAIYPEYKAHREKKRSEKTTEEQNSYYQFLDQMCQLHEILPNFGVHSLKFKGWEGDDLIYAVRKLVPEDEICVIISTDQDMLQLVDEKTFVWSPFKEILITPKNFVQVTGIPKRFYLTYRILVGDKSDNIEGINGIGEKKAKDLIIKFGDIKGMQANAPTLMKSKVYGRIIENPNLLKLNEDLMDMTKIPLNGKAYPNPDNPNKTIWVEPIEEEIRKALETKVKFEKELVRMFLMSKQFVSILKDFNTWSMVFSNLNK